MELINNLSFIDNAANELISNKNCTYNIHDIWVETSKYPGLVCTPLTISTPQETFKAYHIHNREQKMSSSCVLYLHGLSSYCIEGLHLLQHITEIGNKYGLVLYDTRGHGKNTNKKVTYGIKQSTDLYYLVTELTKLNINRVCLWGRSMGASTILNFLIEYGHYPEMKKIIDYVVLDSPFSSFQQIAKETLSRSINLPSFICSPLVNMAINRIQQNQGINLRNLNFESMHYINYPVCFIYSGQDQIVLAQHTKRIIQGYGGKVRECKGNFEHNEVRPLDITRKALAGFQLNTKRKISGFMEASEKKSKKGLSISLVSQKTTIQQKENKSNFDIVSQKSIRNTVEYYPVNNRKIRCRITVGSMMAQSVIYQSTVIQTRDENIPSAFELRKKLIQRRFCPKNLKCTINTFVKPLSDSNFNLLSKKFI